RAYGKALDMEPGDHGTLLRRGTAYLHAHNLDAAEADLRAAVKAAPAALDARYALGEMLARYRLAAAAQKESEQILRSLLTENAGMGEAHRELGRVLGNQRRWQEAETELRAYVAARPADPEGLYLYTGALRRQGKPNSLVQQQFREAKAAEERHRNLLLQV